MKSDWGKGEDLTLNAIQKESIKGKWIDLGAGDGRYIKELLRKVDEMVLADLDIKEIKKAQNFLTKKQKEKTCVKIFDMTKKFPFTDSYFDGVFCTGTLHLFDKNNLELIFKEINRVLKPNGKIIIDFAVNVRRIVNGKKTLLKDRQDYTLVWNKKEAKKMLKELLKDYDLKFEESVFSDDLTKNPKYGFITEGEFFLIVGKKN